MRKSSSQIAIAGRVLEGETEKAISGAMVKIINMRKKFRTFCSLKASQYGPQWEKISDRPDRKFTDIHGYFKFCHLPPGKYLLEVSKPGSITHLQYGIKDFTVATDSRKKIITVKDDINFFPIGIKGLVIDVDSEKGIGNAKIKINRRSEFIYTDSQGFYRLGLETSTLQKKKVTLKVYASGYQKASEPLHIDLKNVNEKSLIRARKVMTSHCLRLAINLIGRRHD